VMSTIGLLLAASIGLPLLVQSCDLGGFTIDDVSDTITNSNASTSQTAKVSISTGQDAGHLVLGAGQSRTFTALAAARYTVEVTSVSVAEAAGYKKSLLSLRDELLDLSINPGDSAARPEDILDQLVIVTQALQQLQATGLQSCSHALVSGADNHATMTWTMPGGLSGLWVLSCD
jgi:hypothetical protein